MHSKLSSLSLQQLSWEVAKHSAHILHAVEHTSGLHGLCLSLIVLPSSLDYSTQSGNREWQNKRPTDDDVVYTKNCNRWSLSYSSVCRGALTTLYPLVLSKTAGQLLAAGPKLSAMLLLSWVAANWDWVTSWCDEGNAHTRRASKHVDHFFKWPAKQTAKQTTLLSAYLTHSAT